MGRTHLGADHAMRDIAQFIHEIRDDRLGEAGPTAAGVKLVGRGEQRLARDDVNVDAGFVIVQMFAGARTLGRTLLRHAKLHRGQGGKRLFGLPVSVYVKRLLFSCPNDVCRGANCQCLAAIVAMLPPASNWMSRSLNRHLGLGTRALRASDRFWEFGPKKPEPPACAQEFCSDRALPASRLCPRPSSQSAPGSATGGD